MLRDAVDVARDLQRQYEANHTFTGSSGRAEGSAIFNTLILNLAVALGIGR